MNTREINLIGVVGRKRHGKDTLGDFLCEEYDFQKYSFADPVKRGAMEMFGFTEEQMWGDLKDVVDEFWGCTPRDVLKVMGTELFQFDIQKHLPAFEKIGRMIWVMNFMRYYKQNKDKKLVIADVRFIHEAKAIRDLGGLVVKVYRPGMPDGDFHASEAELDRVECDYIIMNDSDLESLYNKMSGLMDGVHGIDTR